MAVDEPEGDPCPGEQILNSPKTYLHISPYPEQHVRSYADKGSVVELIWQVTAPEDVAGPGLFESVVQGRPGLELAAGLVEQDPIHPSGVQGIALEGRVLLQGDNAGVADLVAGHGCTPHLLKLDGHAPRPAVGGKLRAALRVGGAPGS